MWRAEKPHPFNLASLLVRAGAELMFSAHLLTCVDKGRLPRACASWVVTASQAQEQGQEPLPSRDLSVSTGAGQLSRSVLIQGREEGSSRWPLLCS